MQAQRIFRHHQSGFLSSLFTKCGTLLIGSLWLQIDYWLFVDMLCTGNISIQSVNRLHTKCTLHSNENGSEKLFDEAISLNMASVSPNKQLSCLQANGT